MLSGRAGQSTQSQLMLGDGFFLLCLGLKLFFFFFSSAGHVFYQLGLGPEFLTDVS